MQVFLADLLVSFREAFTSTRQRFLTTCVGGQGSRLRAKNSKDHGARPFEPPSRHHILMLNPPRYHHHHLGGRTPKASYVDIF